MALLAPHQDQRFSNSTWSLIGIWADLGAASRIVNLCGTFWTHGQPNVAGISRFGVDVSRHSGPYVFHSCARYPQVSLRELFAFLSLPLELERGLFQSLPKIYDHM